MTEMIPTPLRTLKTYTLYQKKRQKNLNDLTIVNESDNWQIAVNQYPYDAIASCHDLLIAKRKTADWLHLNIGERLDLLELVAKVEKNKMYDAILIPFQHSMTYPKPWHAHLLKIKDLSKEA